MPELDGLQADARPSANGGRARARPRIVAVTANATADDRDACLAAGMDDYLVKPILAEALAEVLRVPRTPATLAPCQKHPRAAPWRLTSAPSQRLRELGGDGFLSELVETFLAEATPSCGKAAASGTHRRRRRRSSGASPTH